MNDHVRSAGRILDVLEFLAGVPKGASLTETCAALDLPKSSTLLLLRTVLDRGYVTKDEQDRYALNEVFRTYGFGWGGHRHARLIAAARPVMEGLCAEVQETVLLGALEENTFVRVLEKVVADQVVRYDVPLATPTPLYCTAMGRTFIAYSPVDQWDAMLHACPHEKLTPKTVTDMDGLLKLVRQARAQGYAVVEEEFTLGGTGIAVPVFGTAGEIIATLDIGCVSTRYAPKANQLIDALLRAAKLLAQRIQAGTPDKPGHAEPNPAGKPSGRSRPRP
jgi:DNA-binding IclR family transcriptional regulator